MKCPLYLTASASLACSARLGALGVWGFPCRGLASSSADCDLGPWDSGQSCGSALPCLQFFACPYWVAGVASMAPAQSFSSRVLDVPVRISQLLPCPPPLTKDLVLVVRFCFEGSCREPSCLVPVAPKRCIGGSGTPATAATVCVFLTWCEAQLRSIGLLLSFVCLWTLTRLLGCGCPAETHRWADWAGS